MRLLLIMVFSFITGVAICDQGYRMWTDCNGKKMSARFLGFSEDRKLVIIENQKTNKLIAIDPKFLSEKDMKFVSVLNKFSIGDLYAKEGNQWVSHHKKRIEQIRKHEMEVLQDAGCVKPQVEEYRISLNPYGSKIKNVNRGRQLPPHRPLTIQRTHRRKVNCGVDLEGCTLIANDGTYLGKITWNDCAADSIFNSVGEYGSDVSSSSIWNDVGEYGSDVSSQSPFNDVATSPPAIFRDGSIIGYLTINDMKPGAIHPKVLLKIIDDSFDEMYRKRLHKLMLKD